MSVRPTDTEERARLLAMSVAATSIADTAGFLTDLHKRIDESILRAVWVLPQIRKLSQSDDALLTCVKGTAERPTTVTCAPASRSVLAMARPMPRVPPTTMTRLPSYVGESSDGELTAAAIPTVSSSGQLPSRMSPRPRRRVGSNIALPA